MHNCKAVQRRTNYSTCVHQGDAVLRPVEADLLTNFCNYNVSNNKIFGHLEMPLPPCSPKSADVFRETVQV
jgi:hypothetical protein